MQHRTANDLEWAHFPSKTRALKTAEGWLYGCFNGVPTDGAVGWAPGGLAVDTSSGDFYTNTGSKASATWTQVASSEFSFTTASTFTLDNDNATGKFQLKNTTGGTNHTVILQTTAPSGATVTLTLPGTSGALALTTDTATDLDLGSSGTKGSLDLFPVTVSQGKLTFTATNMGGARNMDITNDAIASARAYVIPDAGGDGKFVMTTEANSLLVDVNSGDRTMSLSGNVTLAGTLITAGNVEFSGAFAAVIAVPSSSTWTLPGGGGTLALATGAEDGTTKQTFTVDSDNATGKFALKNTQGGTPHTVTLQTSTTTQAVTLTLPDVVSDTLMVLGATQTVSGNLTLTGTQDVRGNISSGASNPNIDYSGSTGTFDTPTGTCTLNGSVASAAGSFSFDLSNFTSTMATPTGKLTLTGDVDVASGKDIVSLGGAAQFDFSAANGAFKTTSGTVSINGTTTLAASKNISCAGGTTAVDWSGGSGTFKSTTGNNQLSGTVTITDADTPSLTCASGKTNGGFVSVLGKTNGGIKILSIDSGTSLLTISQEAQTQACTMLIPDLNVATGQFACVNADQTVTINPNAGNRTVSLSGDLTIAGDFITSGANSLTLTTTGSTTVTLPTSGTLASIGGTETLTNKTIDGDDNTLQDIAPTVAKSLIERLTAVTAVPSISFMLTFAPRNDAGETLAYTIPAGKTLRVLDVRGYKQNGNGGSGDTVTIKNAGNAITDAINLQINDKLVFAAGTIDDLRRDVAAGAALQIVTAFNTDCACSVNVLCVWV